MIKKILYSLSIVSLALSLTAISGTARAAFEDGLFFDEALAVGNENLEEMRGTALSPEILGIAVFDAISTNNSSNGTISGGNIIDAGAFSYSSGLSTIIQNSGNNVLIQSATILNLNIK